MYYSYIVIFSASLAGIAYVVFSIYNNKAEVTNNKGKRGMPDHVGTSTHKYVLPEIYPDDDIYILARKGGDSGFKIEDIPLYTVSVAVVLTMLVIAAILLKKYGSLPL